MDGVGRGSGRTSPRRRSVRWPWRLGLWACALAAGCDDDPGQRAGDGAPPAIGDRGVTPNGDGTAVDGSAPRDQLGPDAKTDGGTPPGTDGGMPPTWWQPTSAQPIHWHWQLSTDFQIPRDVLPKKTVYDLDGELTDAGTVAALHAQGAKVICYFDAGVFEDYRSDAGKFPASVIGKSDVGWAGSYWLDIRQTAILLPIMRDRMISWCKNKGFDAVEPDETEVWSNDSGFPVTKADNMAYNIAIAGLAHSLGLSVGLKGNNTEAPALEPYFDWALTEQCWEYDECSLFETSFLQAGKAVFNVEYDVDPDCAKANAMHMNSSRRDLDLVGPTMPGYLYQPCVPDTQDVWP